MWIERDYKDCVRLSLRVMQELREKIYKDSLQHCPGIYMGLHESGSEKVRELYFQAYKMEWLDSHWELLTDLLKRRVTGFRSSEQQEISLFFAEHFSGLLADVGGSDPTVDIAMRDLISVQKNIILEMIECSDKWEERSNQLKVNMKKHKEHYKRLIAEAQAREETEGK